MPLFPSATPPGFLQNDSGTPTIVSGTIAAGTAVISYNTNVFNNSGAITYSTGTGLATINIAGVYLVSAQIVINATYTVGQVSRIYITQNGTGLQYGTQTGPTAATNIRPAVAIPVKCAAGDTIGLLAFSNGTSPVLQNDQGANFFSIVGIR